MKTVNILSEWSVTLPNFENGTCLTRLRSLTTKKFSVKESKPVSQIAFIRPCHLHGQFTSELQNWFILRLFWHYSTVHSKVFRWSFLNRPKYIFILVFSYVLKTLLNSSLLNSNAVILAVYLQDINYSVVFPLPVPSSPLRTKLILKLFSQIPWNCFMPPYQRIEYSKHMAKIQILNLLLFLQFLVKLGWVMDRADR